MRTIVVYEPPQSCSLSGCGPDAAARIEALSDAFEWLESLGVSAARFDMGRDPAAFFGDPQIRAILDRDGLECLPLTLVDGEVLLRGEYPTRGVLERAFGGEAGAAGLTASGDRSG